MGIKAKLRYIAGTLMILGSLFFFYFFKTGMYGGYLDYLPSFIKSDIERFEEFIDNEEEKERRKDEPEEEKKDFNEWLKEQ